MVEVEAGHALELGHALQVEVGRHEADVEAAGEGHELGVDGGELGDLVVEDVERHARVALEGVEDLQAPPAPTAASRLGGVGDALHLVEHEAGDEQRTSKEAGLGQGQQPPVDGGAAVDDDSVGAAAVARGLHQRSGGESGHGQELLALASAHPEALVQTDPHE